MTSLSTEDWKKRRKEKKAGSIISWQKVKHRHVCERRGAVWRVEASSRLVITLNRVRFYYKGSFKIESSASRIADHWLYCSVLSSLQGFRADGTFRTSPLGTKLSSKLLRFPSPSIEWNRSGPANYIRNRAKPTLKASFAGIVRKLAHVPNFWWSIRDDEFRVTSLLDSRLDRLGYNYPILERVKGEISRNSISEAHNVEFELKGLTEI